MSYMKTEFRFPSASGLTEIYACKYIPQDPVRRVVQIAHGMAEHLERYEPFIEVLCSHGIAVYINDHLGHGKSASDPQDRGYFGPGGYVDVVKDMAQLTQIAKADYPDVPFVLFGHSMGSFMVRTYAANPLYNGNLDGLIVCGTGGPNGAVGVAIGLTKFLEKCRGDRHRSVLINALAFGSYNKRCQGRTLFDWLTKDEAAVDAYIADENCGFLFTTSGFLGLFGALRFANSEKCMESTPKELPILLISGTEDPVGGYGKGVDRVQELLTASGHRVRKILYPNARHEILNESDTFPVVCADVLGFVEEIK